MRVANQTHFSKIHVSKISTYSKINTLAVSRPDHNHSSRQSVLESKTNSWDCTNSRLALTLITPLQTYIHSSKCQIINFTHRHKAHNPVSVYFVKNCFRNRNVGIYATSERSSHHTNDSIIEIDKDGSGDLWIRYYALWFPGTTIFFSNKCVWLK